MGLILSAGTVVAGGTLHRPGWLELDDGRVAAAGSGRPPKPATDERPTSTVVPGFLDLHVHGGGGGMFGQGQRQARRAVAIHRAHGTTGMMASLVSAHPEPLLRQVAELAELVDGGEIVGIHLEGPWLSPNRLGAHDATALRPPDRAEIAAVLAAGRGAVRMVTIAPELPGAIDAIKALRDAGVLVAVGHTEATYDQTGAAIAAGATVATHLFNAMRPIAHREPGPIVALAESPQVVVEMILDGIHVHPAVYRQVRRWVGPDRLALVTDAMAAAGAPDGDYRLGTVDVTVTDGVARVGGSDTLAGSTATTGELFRNACRFAAGDPDDVLLDAVRQTSAVPARVLGLAGTDLAPGGAGNLVILNSEGAVDEVWIAGPRWAP